MENDTRNTDENQTIHMGLAPGDASTIIYSLKF